MTSQYLKLFHSIYLASDLGLIIKIMLPA